MQYRLTNKDLDLLMPLARELGVTPMKLIEDAIQNQYNKESHVCPQSQQK